jgi:hypothetical protein
MTVLPFNKVEMDLNIWSATFSSTDEKISSKK